jgi:hypothetical protein
MIFCALSLQIARSFTTLEVVVTILSIPEALEDEIAMINILEIHEKSCCRATLYF